MKKTAISRAFRNARDGFGRLAKIAAPEGSVEFRYDGMNRLAEERVNGVPIRFAYDRYGRLASKTIGDGLAEVRYFYGEDGRLAARLANGRMQSYRHDRRGQLVEVLDAEGNTVEKYAYDPAGNLLAQTVNGQTTTFAYDEANQLVSKTLPDGTVVTFGYDAAGRLVREGDRHYAYGWLDKVLAVTGADGKTLAAYSYGLDNQLASATVGGETEEFLWDGLALVRRGTTGYLNEPHANGGSPILSSSGELLFNDLLGSTLGALGGDGYKPLSLTAFGDTEEKSAFFTGKPQVEGLGYAFLLRNYRPDHGKWLTADPLGYPDGWNNLAYCNNMVTTCIDVIGLDIYHIVDDDGSPGHSALIIGNPAQGYTALHNGVGGGYDAGTSPVDPSALAAHTYDTPAAALNDLNTGRITSNNPEKEYDRVQVWRTNASQDAQAITAAKASIDSGYSYSNNCVTTVATALDAAAVTYCYSGAYSGEPGLDDFCSLFPSGFYDANIQYSTPLDYQQFKNGIVE